MTVIRIDPAQLDDTAALLDAGAGEYEAIGSALAYADLGAMPANVAGAVGAAYADVRSILADLSNQLAGEAQTLRFRSNTAFEDGGLASQLGVMQADFDGVFADPFFFTFELAGLGAGVVCCCCSGTIVGNWDDEEPLVENVDQTSDVWSTDSAVSAAWGPGVSDGDAYTTVIGGGFDTSVFGDSGGGYTTIVGGNFELPTSDVGGYTTIVGGGFDTSLFGDSGGGYTTVVGGNFDIPTYSDGGGYSLVVGGDFDIPTYSDGGGYTAVIGGNFTISDTGSPTDGLLALSQLIDNRYQNINAELDALMSSGGVYGDASDPVGSMLSMDAFRHMMTSYSRMQTTMSPLFNPDMSDPNYESQFGSYAYEW